MLRVLRPRVGEAILDAGCGGGYYTEALHRQGALVTGTDMSIEMVRQVRRATGLPVFASNLEQGAAGPVFDAVLSCGALEFCRAPEKAVREMAEALRPGGGRVVLMIPAVTMLSHLYRYYHARHGVSINLFSFADVESMARAAGLQITESRRAGFNHVVRMEPAGEGEQP